jgi:hypothetical protein
MCEFNKTCNENAVTRRNIKRCFALCKLYSLIIIVIIYLSINFFFFLFQVSGDCKSVTSFEGWLLPVCCICLWPFNMSVLHLVLRFALCRLKPDSLYVSTFECLKFVAEYFGIRPYSRLHFNTKQEGCDGLLTLVFRLCFLEKVPWGFNLCHTLLWEFIEVVRWTRGPRNLSTTTHYCPRDRPFMMIFFGGNGLSLELCA